MTDEPFYAPGAKPRHGEWGAEAQVLKNEELLIGRRFDTREQAMRRAEEECTAFEKGWEDA